MGKWEMVRLGDVCEITNGFAFDSKFFNTSANGIPVIRIRDVVRGYTETYTTEDFRTDYIIKKGDLLIGMDGEFNISPWNSEDALLNQRVCKIKSISEKIANSYLLYFLPKALKDIEDATAFVTVKHLSSKQINNIEIPLPPLVVQQQIADALDRASTLIEKRKAQIDKLDLLVKSQFIEMFGDPVTNPKGWERVAIDDVCSSIVRGPFGSALKKDFFVSKGANTYKVYEQKHAIQSDATIGSYYITGEKFQELRRFECKSGDIIMSCSGTMGKFYQLPEKIESGVINQALCKFTLNDRILSIVFLTHISATIGNLETKGSGIKNIAAVSYVKTMPVNLPPLSLQTQFADFVQQIETQKSQLQQSLSKLEQNYKSLMQKCFRGQIF